MKLKKPKIGHPRRKFQNPTIDFQHETRLLSFSEGNYFTNFHFPGSPFQPILMGDMFSIIPGRSHDFFSLPHRGASVVAKKARSQEAEEFWHWMLEKSSQDL